MHVQRARGNTSHLLFTFLNVRVNTLSHTHTHTQTPTLSHTPSLSLSISFSYTHTHLRTHMHAITRTRTHSITLAHQKNIKCSHTHTHLLRAAMPLAALKGQQSLKIPVCLSHYLYYTLRVCVCVCVYKCVCVYDNVFHPVLPLRHSWIREPVTCSRGGPRPDRGLEFVVTPRGVLKSGGGSG